MRPTTVDVPVVIPVASPAAVIVATDVVDEVQVTWLVRFCMLESEYVPVAVNCCVPPCAIDGFAGVTAIEVSVAVAWGLNTTSTQ